MNEEKIYQLTKAANDASLRGHISRNAEQVVQVYTDDAIIIPPQHKPIEGLPAIKAYYEDGLKTPGKILKIDTHTEKFELLAEDHAMQVGTYVIQYQADTSQASIDLKGVMLIHWKNIHGQWKIKYDMWH